MKTIRLLGIAPYEELNHSMKIVAQQFKEFTIDIYTANLNGGKELAQQLLSEEYDAIVSRGGTADLIQEAVDIPVIDISISIYDILSSIQLAHNYSKNIAIVGYESITKTAHLICNILNYHIKIITIDDSSQTKEILTTLKLEGCKLVLCDAITKHIALELSINTILITSGSESIQLAYKQAMSFTKYLHKSKLKKNILEQAILQQTLTVLIIDKNWNIVHSNLSNELMHSLLRLLKKRTLTAEQQLYHTHRGQTYQVRIKPLQLEEDNYFQCEVKQVTPPLIQQQLGVAFHSRSDIAEYVSKDHLFSSFIQEKNLILMSQLLKHYNAMLIFGEEGTTKTSLAYSCFLKFEQHTANLVTINCKLFGERLWKYLGHSMTSPLLDKGNTLLFQHCEQLSISDLHKLIEIIKDSQLLQRQNIIFVYTTQKADSHKIIFNEIVAELNCASLYSSSLSDRHAELTSIITLLLNKMNIECHTQVIGFNPQAMELLQNFQWTSNFYQLERVIKKLALAAHSYYISEFEVAEVLAEERKHQNHLQLHSQMGNRDFIPAIIEEKTLFDYNQDLVQAILEYNKGNQTKTAKQLGISRTTLWRYLKLDKETSE